MGEPRGCLVRWGMEGIAGYRVVHSRAAVLACCPQNSVLGPWWGLVFAKVGDRTPTYPDGGG